MFCCYFFLLFLYFEHLTAGSFTNLLNNYPVSKNNCTCMIFHFAPPSISTSAFVFLFYLVIFVMSSLVYTIKKPNDTSLHLPALSYNYIIIFTLFRFIVLNQYLLRSLSGDAPFTAYCFSQFKQGNYVIQLNNNHRIPHVNGR